MLVGYKLVRDSDGEVVQQWGGTWGIYVSAPNPMRLPNGDDVHAPAIGQSYAGYTLMELYADEPLPRVAHVTPRQAKLALLAAGLLDSVESIVIQQDRATQISWNEAIEFRRSDTLINNLGKQLGLTDEQIDNLFLEASKL